MHLWALGQLVFSCQWRESRKDKDGTACSPSLSEGNDILVFLAHILRQMMPAGGPVGQGSFGSVLEIGTSCHEMSEPYLFTDDCFFLSIEAIFCMCILVQDHLLLAAPCKWVHHLCTDLKEESKCSETDGETSMSHGCLYESLHRQFTQFTWL